MILVSSDSILLFSFGDLPISHESVLVIGFIMFFIGTVIAVHLSQHQSVRRFYVIGLICVVLLVNLTGVNVAPVVHLHKYTSAAGEEQSHHEIRLVDENGEEIRLDSRAVAPINDRAWELAPQLATEQSNEDYLRTSEIILSESDRYRKSVESGGIQSPSVSFPLPSITYRWTADKLANYGEFETVRVYRVDRTYGSNSYDIAEREEELLVEVTPESSEVQEFGRITDV